MICQIVDEIRIAKDMPTTCDDCAYAETCELHRELKRLRKLCADKPDCITVADEPGVDNSDGHRWIRKVTAEGRKETCDADQKRTGNV